MTRCKECELLGFETVLSSAPTASGGISHGACRYHELKAYAGIPGGRRWTETVELALVQQPRWWVRVSLRGVKFLVVGK